MKRIWKYLIPLLSAVIITVLIALGILWRVDKWTQDWLYQHRGVPSSDIILIGIDEETLSELGPYGPSYRSVMAFALEKLASDPKNMPAVVAIDVLYEGESGSSADGKLATAAEKLGSVVTASMVEYGDVVTWDNSRAVSWNTTAVSYVAPYEQLRAVTTQGHINAMSDKDGVLRHALLYVEKPDGEQEYSMAAQTARLYLKKQGEKLHLPSGNAGGHYYISYTGKPGDYDDGYSLYRLVMGQVPSSAWSGKIVLIGPYAAAMSDDYFTTISKGKKMFGVEYQANVIQNLLENNYKYEVTDLPQLIALFIVCIVAMMLFMRLPVIRGSIVCVGMILASAGLSYLLYRFGLLTHPLWLPFAILILFLISMAIHYAIAAKEKQRLALENERIGAELALATRIQSNSLPKEFPPFPDRKEFDIYASMTPAKEVGGDLYDFFLIDDDHLALTIGDVSGKGVPAALFMMLASALIRNAAMNETNPAKILTLVNQQICFRNPEEMFVTVWMGILEISTGILTAANAGHEYPALKQADGSFELFKDKHGVAVGAMDGIRYRPYTIQLTPGSKLFVYTDGVAEATDSNEQLFGTERMITALRKADNGTPEEVLQAVKSDVDEFVGKAPQFDDLTMLCIRYHGPEKAGDQSYFG